MKDIKDTIDVSGNVITKIGNMTWRQVLTFLMVILIILSAVGSVAYITAEKGASDAVKAELEFRQKSSSLFHIEP